MPLWRHLVAVSWNVFLGDSYSVRFWVGAVKGHGFWWQDAAQASKQAILPREGSIHWRSGRGWSGMGARRCLGGVGGGMFSLAVRVEPHFLGCFVANVGHRVVRSPAHGHTAAWLQMPIQEARC